MATGTGSYATHPPSARATPNTSRNHRPRVTAPLLRQLVRDALVTVGACHLPRQELLVHRAHEILLLCYHVFGDRVAGPAIGGIVGLVLGPDVLRHAGALLLELFLGVDHAAHLADSVLDAGLGLVPEQLGVVVRNVAIVAARRHASPVH